MLHLVEHSVPPLLVSHKMFADGPAALQEVAAVEPPVLRTLNCLLWARARSGRCGQCRAFPASELTDLSRASLTAAQLVSTPSLRPVGFANWTCLPGCLTVGSM